MTVHKLRLYRQEDGNFGVLLEPRPWVTRWVIICESIRDWFDVPYDTHCIEIIASRNKLQEAYLVQPYRRFASDYLYVHRSDGDASTVAINEGFARWLRARFGGDQPFYIALEA